MMIEAPLGEAGLGLLPDAPPVEPLPEETM